MKRMMKLTVLTITLCLSACATGRPVVINCPPAPDAYTVEDVESWTPDHRRFVEKTELFREKNGCA